MLEITIKSFVLVIPVLIAIERKKVAIVLLSFLLVMTPTGLDLIFNFPKDLRWILTVLQILLWIIASVMIIRSPTSSNRGRASG